MSLDCILFIAQKEERTRTKKYEKRKHSYKRKKKNAVGDGNVELKVRYQFFYSLLLNSVNYSRKRGIGM